jgi:hypothetical protein
VTMNRTPLAPTFHRGPTRSSLRTRKGLDAPQMLTLHHCKACPPPYALKSGAHSPGALDFDRWLPGERVPDRGTLGEEDEPMIGRSDPVSRNRKQSSR